MQTLRVLQVLRGELQGAFWEACSLPTGRNDYSHDRQGRFKGMCSRVRWGDAPLA